MKPYTPIRTHLALMVSAVLMSSLLAADAQANGINSSATPATTRAAAAGLNLLSAPRPGQPRVRVRSMGAGSWVCSPAGFGQRSRCYRN